MPDVTSIVLPHLRNIGWLEHTGPGEYGVPPLDPGLSTVNMTGSDKRIPDPPNGDVPGEGSLVLVSRPLS